MWGRQDNTIVVNFQKIANGQTIQRFNTDCQQKGQSKCKTDAETLFNLLN